MSDFIPQKPSGVKIGGLGPKAQRLQALREKAAKQKDGDKSFSSTNTSVTRQGLLRQHEEDQLPTQGHLERI